MEKLIYQKAYAKYTSLSVLGTLGVSCYILADIFFVSRGLGTDGLAAMNIAIPVYNFIHGSGLMLGMGGATKFTIQKAGDGEEQASRIYTNTIYLALAFSLVFASVGLFCSRPLVILLGADERVLPMTDTYLKWLLLFSPAFILNDVFLCFVRNDGGPRLAMTATLVSSMANILLDYIFIFPFKLGIFGAILATGVSPVISMSIMSLHRLKRRNHFHQVRTGFSPGIAGQIFSLGFPSLIAQLSSGITMITFNTLILGLEGNTGVAAYGVIANISLVVVAVFTGIAQGVQPLFSDFYGSGHIQAIKWILDYALKTVLAASLLIYLLIVAFSEPIVGAFNGEGNMQMQVMAVYGMRIYFISPVFVGCNLVISMLFTATEHARPAQILSLLRGAGLLIPIACLLCALKKMTGIWLAYPVTEAITAAIGFPICRCYIKSLGGIDNGT